ncbi:protein ERGIC-53-like [Sarcophilus harrisii]|uniref:protein ERGIC-53-like n=1 Tax=Sarcophilus harrisii TaxID=9305 RepID=UPI001301D5E0|nr:protein ERGIC-53-like [Sarcophilus harrisii]
MSGKGRSLRSGSMESGPSPLLCLLLLLLPSYSQTEAAPPWHRRFEYKFSFKGPRLAIAGQEIPFWSHHGDAIPGMEEVRLAPSMRNKSGSMWTQAAIPFPNWEVEVAFRVSGPGHLGAEGMAVWYTRDRGQSGPALGAPAFWDGVGILFDSFDNDAQNNPVIQILANDGQVPYDHLRDGGGQVLGSCLWDFRNQPYPFRARISYWEEKLRVSVSNGFTTQGAIDEVCAEVGPLLLPPGGYFGVSAATGTVADDHDILSFLTFSLSKPAPEAPHHVIHESEQQRLQYQLQDVQKELKHQKETSPKLDLAISSWGPEEGYLDLEPTLKRHSQVLTELQDLSGKVTQTVGQWRGQMQSLRHLGKEKLETDGAPANGWNSASIRVLLHGQQTLLQNMQEMRAAAASIASRAKAVALPVGTEHHFQELHQTIALLQRDVESLLLLPVGD